MAKRNKKEHLLTLSAFVMLGCFTLLTAVFVIGMYALTFVTEVSIEIIIRTCFIIAGTLGLIMNWKFFTNRLMLDHSRDSSHSRVDF